MKTNVLLRKLAINFPKRIKDGHDYVGLMTGKLKEETKVVLLCLDFDEEVYDYVVSLNKKPDLILTHHPFIYGTRHKVLSTNENKRILVEKIDALDIPVYSMHTNFDTGHGGMNDALAEALKLENIRVLSTVPMARGGELPYEMDVEEFAKYAKKCLKAKGCSLIDAGKKRVRSVAIIGGGGWYIYFNAKLENYDAFISGDIPHHGRRDVIAEHFDYLDMPHEIERIFMPTMDKILKKIDPEIETIIVDHEQEPKRF